MIETTLLYATISILLFLFWIWLLNRTDPVSGFPGPKGIPIFGNTFQLGVHNVHIHMAEWARDFGNVYKLNLMGEPALIVSGYEEIYDVLVNKGKQFGGKPDTYRLKKAVLKNLNSLDPGSHLKSLRKSFMSHLKLYGDGIQQIEFTTTKVLKEHFKSMPNNQPIGVLNMIESILIDIMEIMVFGEKGAITSEEKCNVLKLNWLFLEVNDQCSSGTMLDIFPFLRFFGNQTAKKIEVLNKEIKKQYGIWANKMAKVGETLNKNNFLIKMEKAVSDGYIDEDEAIMNVFLMFFGGISTTTIFLQSLLNILVHKPEIQVKLRKEIFDAIGDRDITYADKDILHYHQAVIFETFRYVSSQPFIFHKTIEETELMGRRIPANTLTWIHVWALHHSENIWGDPFTFRPERFLDEDGHLLSPDHPLRMRFLAFGAGYRVCPGEMFARPRVLILLAMFLREFHILPETTLDEQISYDPIKISNSGLLLMHPDYKVRLQSCAI